MDELANLVRRHSTAAVLLHRAVADRLGLGPTDHKCFDLLRERGPSTGAELATITGLTSGAITGVVGRLESAGYVRREPDPHDGRKQVVSAVPARVHDVHDVLRPLQQEVALLLGNFDADQLDAVAAFLAGSTEAIYRHVGALRADRLQPSRPLHGPRDNPAPQEGDAAARREGDA